MSPEELEKARAAINSLLAEGWDNDAATVRELVAEIERLKSELESLNIELMAAGEIVRAKDARIKELDGMLDARSKEIVGRIQECQACQIDQLRAEGKIGPDADECPDDLPPIGSPYRSCRITEERKAALSRAYDVISWIDRVDSDNQKHIDVLRAMLEAGQ